MPLNEYLKNMDSFAVIWDGHTSCSMHIFKMNDVAKSRRAESGGVYGAMYEQFYDLTKDCSQTKVIHGEYNWKEPEWFEALMTK